MNEDNVSVGATSVNPAPTTGKQTQDAAGRYLSKLLGNIADMLAYASARGITLPEELRGKIGTLLQDPDVLNDPAAAKFGR